jgi:transcriptional regulator with XRE-family HTH domain
MTLAEGVSTEIRVLLARRGMSQRDLAVAAGLNPVALSRRMTGLVDWSLADLAAVAGAFDVDPSSLLPDPVKAP